MKMRNHHKASKIHPSSSTTTTTTTAAAGDSLSALNLLPAAILSLAVVLSLEDRQVLAYMITRSINSQSSSSSVTDYKKKTSSNTNSSHKSPLFDCDCFDCYTNYWFKWDQSPNRDLIHQAIEAFEETLVASTQHSKKNKNIHKSGRRHKTRFSHSDPLNDVALVTQPETEPAPELEPEPVNRNPPEAESSQTHQSQAQSTLSLTETVTEKMESKRKVLPDVMGLFNWRLWSLWSPSDNNNF